MECKLHVALIIVILEAVTKILVAISYAATGQFCRLLAPVHQSCIQPLMHNHIEISSRLCNNKLVETRGWVRDYLFIQCELHMGADSPYVCS